MFKQEDPISVGLLLSLLISTCIIASGSSLTAITSVTTSEDLNYALLNAVEDSVIELADGIYEGQFSLRSPSTTIRGQGEGTILELNMDGQPALSILGSNCTVENLRITSTAKGPTTGLQVFGSNTVVTSLSLEGFATAIRTYKDNNTFYKISIKNCVEGFNLKSNGNWLVHIKLEDIVEWPISIWGDRNIISKSGGARCPRGVFIYGDRNTVHNVEFKSSLTDNCYIYLWGVYIPNGSGNLVDGFRFERQCLSMDIESRNNTVRNSVFAWCQDKGRGNLEINVGCGWGQ